MSLMRLQKFLSKAGICSRRKGEEYIQSGLVRVNNTIVTELGTKIDPVKDSVEFKGKAVKLENDLVYILLNKPKGYVTSCRQPGEKIVLDLIDVPQRIYPIGRLDKDSTGLLILTNDGNLHHKLSHPSFDHEKEYDVTVSNPITDGALQNIARGMPMMGTKTRPAEIIRLSSRRFRIVLKEGKNRQIRRMIRKVGNHVIRLKRLRISNIKLKGLDEGAWRYLTKKEQKALTI
ncbi:MAG: rRNA pseudouridine synthase [Deltaproteobacteria bacterium]|nr:rRNA pseudouridine synthase [Deltaproteobacteria bacterium]